MKFVTDASCEALEPVRIAIRERPTGRDEVESIVQHHGANDQILVVDERPFAFDYVFRPETSQVMVYDALIRPLVVKMINGFYCTALAYGQTGTGKTFTMGLQWDHSGPHDINRGMITRALDQTFELLREARNKEDYEIEVSFIEIYNEKIYDLLSENSSEPVNTRGCKFNGGTKRQVTRADQAQDILLEGNKNRHVRPTKMNTLSSRSHAIFSIHASVVHDDARIVSALHLVDLAGSEGVRRTGHQGVALAEGVHINQGLLSIGKVLQALSIGSKVIPYRDSILSSVLQDSLNSNSYLTLLACISPMQEDLSETLSTIRFAQGAKTLKNNPQINLITAELKTKERSRTPGKNYVPGGTLRNKNLTAKTPKSAKRPLAGAGSSVKKVHSNTFCTPSKIRKLDYGKLNTTIAPVPFQKPAPPPPEPAPVMVAPPTRAALQQMMPPPAPIFPRFSDVTERDFDCIPSDCRSSMLSLNLSSSTSVDAPSVMAASSASVSGASSSQVSSYSPIVKKCMETFEATIEQKLAQMFERIQHFAPPSTPAPVTAAPQPAPVPATPVQQQQQQPIVIDCTVDSAPTPSASASSSSAIPWDMIRREIQEAIRSEISTINDSHAPKYETSTPCRVNESRLAAGPTTAIKLVNPALQRLKEQAKTNVTADDSLGEVGGGGDLDGTVVMNTKTPRRYEVISVDSEEEEVEDDEEGVVVRRRISKRLSGTETRQPFARVDANVVMAAPKTVQVNVDESYLWEVGNGQVRRRSTRISNRKSAAAAHTHSKKGCCPSTKKKKQQRFEPLVEEEDKENEGHVTMRKKAAPMTISNKVIAGYFQTPGGGKKEPKMTASKHGKAVLDLVNRGSIKEVQILPTVGLKMAYQIVTHRTINGKFKKIDDLTKLFVGGKKWTKFLEANYLS